MAPDTGGALWADHLPVFQAFAAVTSQWNVVAPPAGGMRAVGLDYAGVRAGLEMAGIVLSPDQWADLRLIEAGARDAMNGEAS
ncbi:DUF1799 domain-containing protein [Sedimentitalea sp. JM2-8]|uniref:DUF1799 domain-containing protein n=1 Tax=Sedimentitalea xiamensis TaxID=3050037 RepID=A0ABT7FCC5_9RHOB|nr:DUF1799 domain-containing protein [Sedimentitalea xiamensis]MDK3072771.1 DUF1799 domain-containing protein [Sedimentitalea xiamensis]